MGCEASLFPPLTSFSSLSPFLSSMFPLSCSCLSSLPLSRPVFERQKGQMNGDRIVFFDWYCQWWILNIQAREMFLLHIFYRGSQALGTTLDVLLTKTIHLTPLAAELSQSSIFLGGKWSLRLSFTIHGLELCPMASATAKQAGKWVWLSFQEKENVSLEQYRIPCDIS